MAGATGRTRRVDPSVRAALIIDVAPFRDELAALIDVRLEGTRAQLGVQPFEPMGKHFSMVAYGDGAFYGKHIDMSVGAAIDRPPRQITFVYYFFREPKRFSGGALRLFDMRLSGQSMDVEPEHDMLLAFPSWMPHEVLPIACPGCGFGDGRFAVNIWVLGRGA